MHHLDAEGNYLCDLARAWAGKVPGTVPPAAALDPDRFLRQLASQPAMQTLVPHLDPMVLPVQERTRLDQAVEVARRRTTFMLLELERVLPALGEIGCRPVVLKGASLALTVYDRPEDRWFVDIDLLVRRDELPAVYAALERLGYRFARTVNPARYYEDYHFHRIFISNQGVCIEVHWAVTLPQSVYAYDPELFWRTAVEIPLGEGSFLAPGAVDQINHGVLQAIAGGFGDLRRVLDLHLLDQHLDPEERSVLCARAQAGNFATGLWLHYHLREALLGEPIPPTVQRLCHPGPRLAEFIDRLDVLTHCLGQNGYHDLTYTYLMHWLCVPAQYRSREFRKFFFPDPGGLMEARLGGDGAPGLWPRTRLTLERMVMAARLCGRLARSTI
jgi:hypothetical protein